jgi:foldase protein PrsA
MRKQFRKKIRITLGSKRISIGSPMEIIFWLIVLVFLVGAYYTFGAPPSPQGTDPSQAARKVTKNIATVDGKTITRDEFEQRYARQVRNMPSTELVTSAQYMKAGLFDGMVQRLLLLDAAKKENISVSRSEVQAKADELVQQEIDRSYQDRKALAKALSKRNQTLDQLKRELRAEIMSDTEALRESITFEKLEEKIKSPVTVSDEELKDEYAKVRARHILITPDRLKQQDEDKAQAEKAAAKADEKAAAKADEKAAAKADEKAAAKTDEPAKDYKAEAKKLAEELLQRAKKGEDFAALAKEHSADTASAVVGGMLHSRTPPPPDGDPSAAEFFGRHEMVPEFDKAAFGLKPKEISDIVETTYGYHIVQVLDRKIELPKDFDEKKDEYRQQALEQRKNEVWTEYTKALEEKATIEVQDPELAAYRALKDDDKVKATSLLEQAVQSDPGNVGAKYQLAMLYKEAQNTPKAIELLTALSQHEASAASAHIRMELADLLLETGDKQGAATQYKAASDWAQGYEYSNMFMHQQIQMKLEELGEKDLAALEQKWIEDYQAYQAEQGMGGFGGMGGMSIPITPQPAAPDAGSE